MAQWQHQKLRLVSKVEAPAASSWGLVTGTNPAATHMEERDPNEAAANEIKYCTSDSNSEGSGMRPREGRFDPKHPENKSTEFPHRAG